MTMVNFCLLRCLASLLTSIHQSKKYPMHWAEWGGVGVMSLIFFFFFFAFSWLFGSLQNSVTNYCDAFCPTEFTYDENSANVQSKCSIVYSTWCAEQLACSPFWHWLCRKPVLVKWVNFLVSFCWRQLVAKHTTLHRKHHNTAFRACHDSCHIRHARVHFLAGPQDPYQKLHEMGNRSDST